VLDAQRRGACFDRGAALVHVSHTFDALDELERVQPGDAR
jgi:hypothetical protein